MQGEEAQVNYNESDLNPSLLRSLQETNGPAVAEDVRNVTTAEELQAAMNAGVRHIVITEHLDLTSLQPYIGYPTFPQIRLGLSPSTWSIRVRPSCPSVLQALRVTLHEV
jgi:hypothetical protein